MPKIKSIYVCSSCGNQSSQWVGQCSKCNEWNTFQEEVVAAEPTGKGGSSRSRSLGSARPVDLQSISTKPVQRLKTNISEFDRVLGGGFVPGQVTLLAGEPGIGKSTILTEISKNLKTNKVLYVCGEENPDQIKLRTERMNYKAENLLVLPETNLESICDAMESDSTIKLVIVDSIQTLYSNQLNSFSGSLTQVRGCSQVLTESAKRTKIPVVLVGHVTKEGVVAGPKVLEHIVDTVLYLEGDSQHMYRILRTSKNRFGAVSEVGIFEMQESGMREVKNPSELFLSEYNEKSSGSCVTVLMEGFRPLLFEVQALTVPTNFGYPKRTCSGFNVNRLQVLIATLQKRAGVDLSNHDVYLNVAGGFKISEYAADLAVCLALTSSLRDKPVKERTVIFGECGLNGEVRKVSHLEKRVQEAKNLGYTNVISPSKVRSITSAIKSAF